MTKAKVETLLSEAARLSGESEFFVIGSQAAHASVSKPPAEVLLSRECDIYPKNRPELVSYLHEKLGPRSRFFRREGVFGDVVAPELATLPAGWETRLRPLKAGPITGWCLEMNDLIVSKLAAGRLKDLEFVAAMIELGIAKRSSIVKRIRLLDSEDDQRRVHSRLQTVLDDIESGTSGSKPRARKHRGRSP
jgi:hypothetical protein